MTKEKVITILKRTVFFMACFISAILLYAQATTIAGMSVGIVAGIFAAIYLLKIYATYLSVKARSPIWTLLVSQPIPTSELVYLYYRYRTSSKAA